MQTPVDPRQSEVELRPSPQGANIRTWIGFKHLMNMVESAVIQWFRDHSLGPQTLYRDHGLGLEIVEASVRLPALVELDDLLTATVTEAAPGRFVVKVRARRGESTRVVVDGKVQAAVVRERRERSASVPEELAGLVVDDVASTAEAGNDAAPSEEDYRWSWKARYFHCHYSDRVQHSAYVRALEETVDRFLTERGLSIRGMLDRKGWIPVVSRARVRLTADAHMDETVHTSFRIEEFMKGLAYDAAMHCYVERGGTRLRTATARILHGYASSRGDDAGKLVPLDEATLAALRGRR